MKLKGLLFVTHKQGINSSLFSVTLIVILLNFCSLLVTSTDGVINMDAIRDNVMNKQRQCFQNNGKGYQRKQSLNERKHAQTTSFGSSFPHAFLFCESSSRFNFK